MRLKSAPWDFRTAAMLASSRSSCSTIPGPTTFPVSSVPTCPEMNNSFPAFTACEYVCAWNVPGGSSRSSGCAEAVATTQAAPIVSSTIFMDVASSALHDDAVFHDERDAFGCRDVVERIFLH